MYALPILFRLEPVYISSPIAYLESNENTNTHSPIECVTAMRLLRSGVAGANDRSYRASFAPLAQHIYMFRDYNGEFSGRLETTSGFICCSTGGYAIRCMFVVFLLADDVLVKRLSLVCAFG